MRNFKKIILGLSLMLCYTLSYADDPAKAMPPTDINVPQLKSFEKKDIEDFCNKICESACNNVPEVAKADCRKDCPSDCKRDVEREGERRKNKSMNGGNSTGKPEMPAKTEKMDSKKSD